MKAITRIAYGSPDVLKLATVDQPIPKENEILVRVHATTVNRTDCGIFYKYVATGQKTGNVIIEF